MLLALVAVDSAEASSGYELNPVTPSRSIGSSSIPHGLAVDQANHRIYIAVVVTSLTGAPGEVLRFESDLTPAGSFTAGGMSLYAGVAVNPVTQGFYADQAPLNSPLGKVGAAQLDIFSSSGTLGTSTPLDETGAVPQIVTDPTGNVYYPNAATHTVQVFNSAGVLQKSIGCSGCPGGSFGVPVGVALNSTGDLYVVDLNPNRVVKLTLSAGSYSFDSVLQDGGAAAAVAVDPSDDSVFVGNLPNGVNYHVAAYNSSGTQYDDFGAGLFTPPDPSFGAVGAAQMAVDASTHRLYIGDFGKFYLFDRVTAAPPTAAIKPPASVGQVTATLAATVNAHGHAARECEFEYTDHADFLVDEFSSATKVACPQLPDGLNDTTLEPKVSGLTPGTLYHYRVTTTTWAGSVSTTGETFTALPSVPPTVTTEAPTGVSQSGATLNAKVNPQGGTVSSCRFEYGTTASYGTNLSCTSLPGPVATDVAQSRSIAGLAAGTTYHYRLVVTSNAGTTKGQDVAFTTESPASTPPPATDPAPAAPSPVTVTPPPSTRPSTPLHCKKGFQKKKVRGKAKCVKKKKRHRKHSHAGGRS